MNDKNTEKNLKSGIWYDAGFGNHWEVSRRFDLTGLRFIVAGDCLVISGEKNRIKRLLASFKRRRIVTDNILGYFSVSFYDLKQVIR